jgi:hypothetical protein
LRGAGDEGDWLARSAPSAGERASRTAKSAKNTKEILLGFPKIAFPFALFASFAVETGS